MRLKNKVAIVTGGGSGIGKSTAELFASEGACVAVADIDSKQGSIVVDNMEKSYGRGLFVLADVSKSVDAENIVASCVRQFGRLDILFNNAGINPIGTVVTTPEDVWDKVMAVNLKGMFLCSKYAIPVMAGQGGGVIINTASVCSFAALENEVAYDTSKGGVVMLTKAMALDHAKENIRVNCVCPGITDTPLIGRWVREFPDPEKSLKQLVSLNSALKRMIKPEEVASMVLFLASDESSGITGSAFPVDGGFLAT